MEPHPTHPPPTHQLDWETPRAPRRSGAARFLSFLNRPQHRQPAAAAAKEPDLSPLPTHTTTSTTPHHPRTRTPFRFDGISPQGKTYFGFRRRTVLLVLLALLILILALGLGLGLGLRRRDSEALPLPDGTATLHARQLTYYAPGLGACGITSAETDDIVAVSHLLYDAAAEKAGTGANPNANPLCGKRIAIETREGKEAIQVTVVDRCTGCKPRDLDVPLAVFKRLAEEERGRVEMKWRWV